MSIEKLSLNIENVPYIIKRTGEHEFSFCDKNGTEYNFSLGDQPDIHVYPKNGEGVIFRNGLDHREGVFHSDSLPEFVPPEIADAIKGYLNARIKFPELTEVFDATRTVLKTVQSLSNKK